MACFLKPGAVHTLIRSSVQKFGNQCLSRAGKALEFLSSNPEEAKKHLQAIKETTPFLLEKLKERRAELDAKGDELDAADNELKRKVGVKEEEKHKVSAKIRSLEYSKSRNEASLADAERDLSRAQEEKSEAESKKGDAIVGTVAGGVGAAVLGFFFPPSLIVTVPAVAAAGTISITDACEKIDRCKGRISDTRCSIENESRQIRNANSKINGLEYDIRSLSIKQQELHDQVGEIRDTRVFIQKAVTYFSEMHTAVRGGEQKTDKLHKIVTTANKKEQYKIMNSQGGHLMVNSFAQAWEHVENKIYSGDEAGYLRISMTKTIC